MAEAKLENKDRVMITQTCEEIISQAEAQVAKHKAHVRELQEAGDPLSASLRQKAVLFSYQNVTGLNAETVTARYYELKAVVEHMKRVETTEDYRIPVDHLKPTLNWSVDWSADDDAHLLVGIWRHGFGSWEQMYQVSIDPFWLTSGSHSPPRRSNLHRGTQNQVRPDSQTEHPWTNSPGSTWGLSMWPHSHT